MLVTALPTSQGVIELVSEAARLDITMEVYHPRQLAGCIDMKSIPIVRVGPETYDSVYAALATTTGNVHETIFNICRAFDKIASTSIITSNHISMPDTHIVESLEEFERICDEHDFPLVVKEPRSNQGVGVRCISSRDECGGIEFPCIVQEYIECGGSDTRVFVVGDRVVGAIRRSSTTSDFRSNLGLGGHATRVDPSDNIAELAVRTTQLHGLHFAGVDIISTESRDYVLEINSSPGFKIDKIAGGGIVSELLRYFQGINNSLY
ncbi:ATP-grasp domain-containing protein [Candidatus Saccharibacteria bacterium]|nr:ATP-grasp domain-containing protein [Candidatus Saccharibacteria bacterium]